jgi:hypothetical protein
MHHLCTLGEVDMLQRAILGMWMSSHNSINDAITASAHMDTNPI